MFRKHTNLVGQRICAERKRSGLSQEALAAQLYVTRQTISNWEVGKTMPDLESLKLLALALSVPIERLIYGEPLGFPVPWYQRIPWELWCLWLGVVVWAVGLLSGIWAGSGAVQTPDGGVGWGFQWKSALSIWYPALIRGVVLLSLSRILSVGKQQEP